MKILKIKQQLGALILLMAIGLVACQPTGESNALQQDMNGMILGDDNQPPRPLLVGVGDSVSRLLARNPYLNGFTPPDARYELRLGLMTKVDLHYDDGDIKLHIDCVNSINVDGNRRLPDGVAFIGLTLCDSPLNDWKSALKRAADIMQQLEAQNPQIEDLRPFYAQASEDEFQKLVGDIWSNKSEHDIDKLISLADADQKFSREAAQDNIDALSGERKHTYALVGAYVGKKVRFRIGISKDVNYGGDNLTEAQRRTMRYDITMSFKLRNDVNP